jgi:hypothetical protein
VNTEFKRVFASSACYDGALDGLGGADAKCQALAERAGLGGVFKAWLADGENGPATRFVRGSTPYLLVDFTRIAADWADLTDGRLDAAISLDESARPLAGALGCGLDVWTNTLADGSAAIADGYEFVCRNWTLSLYARSALTGDAAASDAAWSDGGPLGMRACSLPARLYCFEQ